MAGLGAKLFASFSKLTAAQVNGYLMDQSIMRFATSAARDAAFGGAGEPTLAEGMTCYLDDTNVLQSYTGSAWVTLVNSTNPPALDLITSCTVTSVGGTSATASGGIITIGTGNTSVTVSNAFSANYDNYKIVVSGGATSAQTSISLVLGAGAGSYYGCYLYGSIIGSTALMAVINNASNFIYAGGADIALINMNIELQNPFLAKYTNIQALTVNYANNRGHAVGEHEIATSYTAFTIAPFTGTMTGGTIRVYGYRNS